MAGLPKKFAKMGFAKGWKAYRQTKSPRKAKKRTAARATPKRKAPARKRASSTAVTVHKRSSGMSKLTKNRIAAMKTSVSKALAKVRAAKATDGGEMAIAVGEGIAAGVASSYAIGMLPVPASLPKPAMIKSAIQVAAGFGLALAIKNKHAKYAGFGMAIIGGIGLARELFPIPTFAGEVDEGMYGADWTPDGYMGNEDTPWMNEPMGEPMGSEAPVSPFG